MSYSSLLKAIIQFPHIEVNLYFLIISVKSRGDPLLNGGDSEIVPSFSDSPVHYVLSDVKLKFKHVFLPQACFVANSNHYFVSGCQFHFFATGY